MRMRVRAGCSSAIVRGPDRTTAHLLTAPPLLDLHSQRAFFSLCLRRCLALTRSCSLLVLRAASSSTRAALNLTLQ